MKYQGTNTKLAYIKMCIQPATLYTQIARIATIVEIEQEQAKKIRFPKNKNR